MQMIVKCPACQQQAPMRHIHDEAHGIPGTHLAGSERFVCTACGHTLTREEANGCGLEFKLDVTP